LNATLLLLADYANTTADNRLNVMGIFTEIRAVNFPAVHPLMYFIAQLSASPAEYGRKFKFGVKLLDADATKELLNFEIEVEVPRGENGQPTVMNFILPLVSIVFEKPGNYQFSLLVNEDEKATYSIEAILIPAPASAE
jgi:hypothetical protein